MKSFKLCKKQLRYNLIQKLAISDSETFKEYIKHEYFTNSPRLPDELEEKLHKLQHLCQDIWKLSNNDPIKFKSILVDKQGFIRVVEWVLDKIYSIASILGHTYNINTEFICKRTAEPAIRIQFYGFLNMIVESQKYIDFEPKK